MGRSGGDIKLLEEAVASYNLICVAARMNQKILR
jgi:hypothetical protein